MQSRQVVQILQKGRRTSTPAFRVSALPVKPGQKPQFTVVVANKVLPRAIKRNQLKRRMREVTRRFLTGNQSKMSYNLVIIAQKVAGQLDFAGIKEQLNQCLSQLP